ncbi:MAG: hypothetical protein V4568_00830 [Pseudomonadota bacterium]
MFDSLVLSTQAGILLITDDLPTRVLSRVVGGAGGAWLHRIFGIALDQRRIDMDTFINWSAQLVNAGHNYIGVSGAVLARAFRLDAKKGKAPGYLFSSLSKIIGGKFAEPRSHIEACIECLRDLWTDGDTQVHCQQASGLLLRQLIRERHEDYYPIILAVFLGVKHIPQLAKYIIGRKAISFLILDAAANCCCLGCRSFGN